MIKILIGIAALLALASIAFTGLVVFAACRAFANYSREEDQRFDVEAHNMLVEVEEKIRSRE